MRWSIGDWLVNYSGGFVRRGLGGEVLLFASRNLGIPANVVALGMFVLAFGTSCAAFLILLRAKRMTFWFFVLCLSPAFVLFTLYNPNAVGRKDSLLLACACVWAVASVRGPLTVPRAAVYSVLAFGLTLVHEVFFFFTPYFVVISYIQARRRGTEERWWMSAGVPIGSALTILPLLSLSASLSDPAICRSLTDVGAAPSICPGVLSYGRESSWTGLYDLLGAVNWRAALSVMMALTLALMFPMSFL